MDASYIYKKWLPVYVKKKKKNASFVIVKLFCQLPEMISILVL